jgi:hypothetical protein
MATVTKLDSTSYSVEVPGNVVYIMLTLDDVHGALYQVSDETQILHTSADLDEAINWSEEYVDCPIEEPI